MSAAPRSPPDHHRAPPDWQNSAQITLHFRPNLVKIPSFGHISAAVVSWTPKHPKLELPQRVEHVSTPREGRKTRTSDDFEHFTTKFGHPHPGGGVLGGENGPKWPKSRFFKTSPKTTPRGQKLVRRSPGGVCGPPGVPQTTTALPQIGRIVPKSPSILGQIWSKYLVLAVSRPLLGAGRPNTQSWSSPSE